MAADREAFSNLFSPLRTDSEPVNLLTHWFRRRFLDGMELSEESLGFEGDLLLLVAQKPKGPLGRTYFELIKEFYNISKNHMTIFKPKKGYLSPSKQGVKPGDAAYVVGDLRDLVILQGAATILFTSERLILLVLWKVRQLNWLFLRDWYLRRLNCAEACMEYLIRFLIPV